MWIATSSPYLRAASATSGTRSASGDPSPHHETTTVRIPVAAISLICAKTTLGFDDE